MGENTRNIVGGFVARLLESLKKTAAATADNAKSAVVGKVCLPSSRAAAAWHGCCFGMFVISCFFLHIAAKIPLST